MGAAAAVPVWLQIAVAAASIIGVGLVVISKIIKGAVRYIDERDKTVHQTLVSAMEKQGHALEKGDMALAGAVERLTGQLESMAEQYTLGQQAMDEKIDRIVTEVTTVNDGGTVKGAIAHIKERVADHDHQLEVLASEVTRNHLA